MNDIPREGIQDMPLLFFSQFEVCHLMALLGKLSSIDPDSSYRYDLTNIFVCFLYRHQFHSSTLGVGKYKKTMQNKTLLNNVFS